MKYCPFCGSGLQEAMVFCPKCGKRFLDAFENPEAIDSAKLENDRAETPVPIQAPVVIQVPNDVTEVDAVAASEPERSPKENSKTTILIAVVLLIVLGVVGFFGMNGADDAVSITDAANSVLYLEVFDDTDAVVATASGFIIEDGTTLVTNYHVIDGAHHIVAYTPDGASSVEIHTVLAFDEKADLAVLKCEDNIGAPPLLLGDSDVVKQGDNVFAVGYPLGVANTLSDGVISSRYLDENNIDILQITAAISSGSSGGALFNEKGQVVGAICASYVDGQNLNIAIPSTEIQKLLAPEYTHQTALSKLYEKYCTPSISRANLAGGGVVVESDEYVFFVDETTEVLSGSDSGFSLSRIVDACIWQYSKADGSLKSNSVRASNLNVYNDKLYYYDYKESDICCCDIGENFGQNATPLNLLESKDTLGSIFFLNGMLVLHKYELFGDEKNVGIYDAKTMDLITTFESYSSYYNVSYLDETIYIVSDTSLCSFNLKTLLTEEFTTPTSLYGLYPVANGKIYCTENTSNNWVDAYGQTVYVFDTKTGTFSELLTCMQASVFLCKDDVVLLHEYADDTSFLYDISSGEKVLFSNQNFNLQKELAESFVIEGNYNIPELGWPTNAILGNYRANNESTFIVP